MTITTSSSPQATGPSRIPGIDLARGAALVGMFTAHFGLVTSPQLMAPSTWGGLVSGRSSILFAILAGVSLAIMTGRSEAFEGKKLADARVKILVRAVCIFGIGLCLTALGSNISIILQAYAVLFIIALALLHLGRAQLLVLALAGSVLGPLLAAVLEPLLLPISFAAPMADLLVWGSYPVLTWLPYIAVGLAIGRTDLSTRRNQLALMGTGTALAVIGYATTIPLQEFRSRYLFSSAEATTFGAQVLERIAFWPTADPHSNTPFEIIGSGGFAIAFLGLCLLIAPWLRVIFAPIIAMGSMSLTTYVVHVITYRGVQDQLVPLDSLAVLPWLVTIAGLGLFALVWKHLMGKGPLERGVHYVVQALIIRT